MPTPFLTACLYPDFCAEYGFESQPADAGASIKPGVERCAEPQVRPAIYHPSPRTRAPAIEAISMIKKDSLKPAAERGGAAPGYTGQCITTSAQCGRQ